MRPVEIPDKLYFKIGEVARIAGVEPYVLRYWETEFKEINPVKSKTNQRLYRRRDIETVLAIKGLLHQEGFTIEGARKKIREMGRVDKNGHDKEQMPLPFGGEVSKKFLKELRARLEEIVKLLEL
jgi:DNA-binding transcriptional MerR regulator